MKYLKQALLSLLLFSSVAIAENKIGYLIYDDYKVAIVLAQKSQMPVLIIFSADWCGYCDKLKSDLVNIKETDQYIICVIDIEKEDYGFKEKMKIRNLPTSVIIDPSNNDEISRKVGYRPEEYKRWLRRKAD
jgi:hypothetical protein